VFIRTDQAVAKYIQRNVMGEFDAPGRVGQAFLQIWVVRAVAVPTGLVAI
jgi:hypothetical protein